MRAIFHLTIVTLALVAYGQPFDFPFGGEAFNSQDGSDPPSLPPPLEDSSSPHCNGATWNPNFPFQCTSTGGCPNFNSHLARAILTSTQLMNFDPDHPEAIYQDWPSDFITCLGKYCDANPGKSVCTFLLSARAAKAAKQTTQFKQVYQNVVCNSVTDCSPWRILDATDHFSGQDAAPGLPIPIAPSVIMRINPLGVFPGITTMHYFYALGQPVSPSLVTPTSSRIQYVVFPSGFTASNNTVCAQIEVVASRFADNSNPSIFTHYSCFSFDENYQVVGGEISFRHLGTKSDQPLSVPSSAVAAALCPRIQAACTGANQQYASLAACQAYVGSLPIVSWDKGNQANIPCISLHQIMIGRFPDIHCPHVGPASQKCTNAHTYNSDYTDFPTTHLNTRDPLW